MLEWSTLTSGFYDANEQSERWVVPSWEDGKFIFFKNGAGIVNWPDSNRTRTGAADLNPSLLHPDWSSWSINPPSSLVVVSFLTLWRQIVPDSTFCWVFLRSFDLSWRQSGCFLSSDPSGQSVSLSLQWKMSPDRNVVLFPFGCFGRHPRRRCFQPGARLNISVESSFGQQSVAVWIHICAVLLGDDWRGNVTVNEIQLCLLSTLYESEAQIW